MALRSCHEVDQEFRVTVGEERSQLAHGIAGPSCRIDKVKTERVFAFRCEGGGLGNEILELALKRLDLGIPHRSNFGLESSKWLPFPLYEQTSEVKLSIFAASSALVLRSFSIAMKGDVSCCCCANFSR